MRIRRSPSQSCGISRPVLVAWLFLAAWTAALALNPEKLLNQYIVDAWSIEDGLPQSSILSILQTHDGYLWMATYEGLVRFDGNSFTVFNKSNLPLLSSNNIRALMEDRDHQLWIGTSLGLLVSREGHFTRYSSEEGLPSNVVLSLQEDRSGRIWVGTTRGLARFEKGRFLVDPALAPLRGHYITTLVGGLDGSLWIGTSDSGLYHYHHQRLDAYLEADGLPSKQVQALAMDRAGNLWIGSGSGHLVRRDGAGFQDFSQFLGGSGADIRVIFEDSHGMLWFGSSDGVVSRLKNEEFSSLMTSHGLSKNSIYAILEDREGSLWIGTYRDGLLRLKDERFILYGADNGLPVSQVRSVFEDHAGTVWIGTVGGGLVRHRQGRFTTLGRQDGLTDDRIWTMAEGPDGSLWVGTYGGGLNRIQGNRITAYTTREGLSNNIVRTVMVDRAGRLWAGTNGGGVDCLSEGKIRNFNSRNGLVDNFVYSLAEDQAGRIWVGTYNGGISIFDNGRWTSFAPEAKLAEYAIWDIYPDPEGTVWIGTNSGGLLRYKDGKISTISVRDGLFSDTIFQIVEDNRGNFWMMANKGLAKVRKQELHDCADGKRASVVCDSFEGSAGMTTLECDGPAQPVGIFTRDARVWFASQRGAVVIDQEYGQINQLPPPIHIEQVLADGQQLSTSHRITLAPGTKRLEFHFTALCFLVPTKVRFRYFLEGYDRQWSPETSLRSAYYTNLAPGDYRFRVQACNNDGIWNRTGASVQLHLTPYFYQTGWFLSLCTLALAAAVIGVHKLRLRSLRQRQQELEVLVRERTKELSQLNEELRQANQLKSELLSIAAHDLKNPLQAVLGYAEMIIHQRPSESALETKINKIHQASLGMLGLINELLESARIESGRISLEIAPLEIGALARSVVENFSLLARQKGQTIEFEAVEPCRVQGDKYRLKEVLENLVGNAVKFSPHQKRIWVRVERAGPVVRVEVRDEGPGLTDADKDQIFGRFQRLSARPTGGESSTGLGLSIAKQLVEMHQGTVSVESEPGQGCRFIVELPVCQAGEGDPGTGPLRTGKGGAGRTAEPPRTIH